MGTPYGAGLPGSGEGVTDRFTRRLAFCRARGWRRATLPPGKRERTPISPWRGAQGHPGTKSPIQPFFGRGMSAAAMANWMSSQVFFFSAGERRR